MIQELLGASSCLNFGAERKISTNGNILQGNPTSSSSSQSPSSSPATSSNPENHQNLRCPRCDSSNTKFCYYNNYNLTQPRHFCKTCRRYWTKGGALRNVPIGGGCRKNRSSAGIVSTSSLGKSASFSKMKTVVPEIGQSGFDHELQSTTPILWTTTSPQSSHLLSLLRTTPNPNALSNPADIKEEVSLLGSQVMNEPTTVATGAGALINPQTLGLDLVNPFWKNNQQNQNNNGFLVGEVQNAGIQELYQRLKSSSPSSYYPNTSAVILSNVASSSSSSSSSSLSSPSSILESAPVAGGELGYWNPTFSSTWSDLPTTTGAYP